MHYWEEALAVDFISTFCLFIMYAASLQACNYVFLNILKNRRLKADGYLNNIPMHGCSFFSSAVFSQDPYS
jgi:hypothetical protein